MFIRPGAAEGILLWYGQPSEVQFTRGGGVAEPKICIPVWLFSLANPDVFTLTWV